MVRQNVTRLSVLTSRASLGTVVELSGRIAASHVLRLLEQLCHDVSVELLGVRHQSGVLILLALMFDGSNPVGDAASILAHLVIVVVTLRNFFGLMVRAALSLVARQLRSRVVSELLLTSVGCHCRLSSPLDRCFPTVLRYLPMRACARIPMSLLTLPTRGLTRGHCITWLARRYTMSAMCAVLEMMGDLQFLPK